MLKKTLFITVVLASMASTTFAAFDKSKTSMTALDAEVAQGGTTEIQVVLKNTEYPVASFQFTVTLPDGVTFVQGDNGYQSTVNTSLMPSAWTLNVNTEKGKSTQTALVSGYYVSGNNLSIAQAEENKIFTFTVAASENATVGDCDITISDLVLGGYPDGEYSEETYSSVSKLTVKDASAKYDDGYSVSIAPIEFNEDIDGLEFVLGTQNALTNLSFDIEFPENIGSNQLYTVSKALGTTTATTSIDDDEAGNVNVTVARKTTKTITDGKTVAKLELGFDGDLLSAGIYPINIKNVKMTDTDGNEYNAAPTTSYIKIGTPTNASLALNGHVTEDVTTSLDSETSITTLDMSNVVSLDGTLTLVDGQNFVAPKKAATFEGISYSRNMSYSFGTICLPYEVTSDATIQYYQLASVSENYMSFEPVASIAAGTPAVFKLLSGTTANMSAENVSVSAGSNEWNGTLSGKSWTMKGTMSAVNLDPTAKENNVYYIADNKFWYANKAFNVPAFRGWFETPKSVSPAKSFNIGTWDIETTDINYIENADGTVDVIFDIAGRKLSSKKNGINIINGKKVLVK